MDIEKKLRHHIRETIRNLLEVDQNSGQTTDLSTQLKNAANTQAALKDAKEQAEDDAKSIEDNAKNKLTAAGLDDKAAKETAGKIADTAVSGAASSDEIKKEQWLRIAGII